MKRILITGANSYLGTSVSNYLLQWPDQYIVDTIDMIDDTWRDKSFSPYDVVYHVAGIAHADVGKMTEECKQKYYSVNTDLAIETAQKAKADGVGQFIFMSSACVYGNSAPIGKRRIITRESVPSPVNHYGSSKLKAEEGIIPLQDKTFRVIILRPPIIYGKGCKGNYPKLVYAAQKTPIFPDIENKRSMLFVGNLCEFIKLMINHEESGLFFPQNREYVKTSEMVRLIGEVHGRNIWMTKLLNPVIRLLVGIKTINKVFGNFTYEQAMSEYENFNYQIYSFRDTIILTELESGLS